MAVPGDRGMKKRLSSSAVNYLAKRIQFLEITVDKGGDVQTINLLATSNCYSQRVAQRWMRGGEWSGRPGSSVAS